MAPSRVPRLVDLAEEVVGGVAGEDVGESRLDTDPDEREATVGLPLPRHGELLVAEHDADLLVGLLGMTLRQAHRHVEVVGPGSLGAVEDRHVELRVDGVEDVRRRVLAGQRRHGLGRRGVDPGRDEARLPRVASGDGCDRALGTRHVVVGDDPALEEATLGGDARGGVTDPAGADHEDTHRGSGHLSVASAGDEPAP